MPAVMIEEPFGVLPLEVICRTIEASVKEALGLHGARHRGAAQPEGGRVDSDTLVGQVVPAVALARNGNGAASSNGNGHANGSASKAPASPLPVAA
jgi:hypothetical protein